MRRGPALEELRRVGHARRVILLGDMADAGGRAPLDLVEQAGPRAAFEHRVGAVAQQEHLLKLVERAVHRPGAGEGAVVIPLLGLGAAVLADLRKRMRLRDQYVGKAFVIAQQHVVFRLELLDQVLLEKQGLGFGPRRQEHHRGRFADHPRDPRRMLTRPGIVRHPRPEIAGLADVENPALIVEHPVDARRRIQRPQVGLDQRVPGLARRRGIVLGRQIRHGPDMAILAIGCNLGSRAQAERHPPILWTKRWATLGPVEFIVVCDQPELNAHFSGKNPRHCNCMIFF